MPIMYFIFKLNERYYIFFHIKHNNVLMLKADLFNKIYIIIILNKDFFYIIFKYHFFIYLKI